MWWGPTHSAPPHPVPSTRANSCDDSRDRTAVSALPSVVLLAANLERCQSDAGGSPVSAPPDPAPLASCTTLAPLRQCVVNSFPVRSARRSSGLHLAAGSELRRSRQLSRCCCAACARRL